MTSISSFFRNIFLDLKAESRLNELFVPVLLVLLTIPLPYNVNSISMILLALVAIWKFDRRNFTADRALIIPILLYLLMSLSLSWSIDPDSTIKALLKEIPLLLIPIIFIISKKFTAEQRSKLIAYYSYGMLIYAGFYLIKAVFRFAASGDSSVFFYHELVTKDLNAIHVSVYMSVAFFYFFSKISKTVFDYAAQLILVILIILLSSKNIIVTFIAILIVYYLFVSKVGLKIRLAFMAAILAIIVAAFSFSNIRDRFMIEFSSNTESGAINNEISDSTGTVYNVSIYQAWNNDRFKPNDFFPGTAFRVYQLRIFLEMLEQENIVWTGFGLNASYPKIREKAVHYNLYMGDASNNYNGYHTHNFHNQYVQNFAELGIFGLAILIIMLAVNLKNAINVGNLPFLAFAILMISLFISETFLWRQRGVVFFIMLYCIFNLAPVIGYKPEKQRIYA